MISNTGTLAKNVRDTLRKKILTFCRRKPRTVREVSDEFSISGISAGAFLSNLILKKDLKYNSEKKKYGKY